MEQKSFMFSSPFEYQLKSNGDLIVMGDISSTDKDLVNDICTLDCLESMKSQIADRNMKLDVEHEAFRGESIEEKEINKTTIPAGRMYDPKIIKSSTGYALQVNAVINQHMNRFNEIKGSIEGKFLDAFSIAFIPTRTKTVVKDGEQVRMLDDVALLNVALTGNPVNTFAQMKEIVSKSIKSLEDYKTKRMTHPEIEENLEVKSELKETGSDKEKRKLRKEALGEEEEEEEEETKRCGKKKEKKSYDKDGGHAHGEKDPAGEHRHPEIEEMVDRLRDMIINLPSPEEAKSHSNENLITTEKEVKKMTEEEMRNEETVEEAKPETPAPESDPVSEIKSMIEAQNAKIDALTAKVKLKDKEDEEEEVKVEEAKANSKAVISASQGNEVKSVQAKAGLSELA